MADQDAVQGRVVDSQALFVFLVGGELGAGGLGEDMLGDGRDHALGFRLRIAGAGDFVHGCLVQAADRGEGTCRVAVQGGIAHHGLALIAGIHHHPTILIGKRHQAHHAAARLGVLARESRELALAGLGKRTLEGLEGLQDADDLSIDSQVGSQLARVVHGMAR